MLSISTRPSAYRSTSWSMPRAMPASSSTTRDSKPPAPKSKPALAPVWKGGSQKSASPAFRDLAKTDFLGYKQLNANDAEVLAIVKDGVGVPSAKAGDPVEVVLDHTSFYGDSGGQVGDTGWFTSPDGNTTIAEITGCVLPVQGVRAHKAILKQDIAVGDHVNTVVDGARRDNIKRNHTGTHLLHAALRQVLGTHVKQAGSRSHPDRLRFDFSHFAQVADEELQESRRHRQPRSACQRQSRDPRRRPHRSRRQRVPRHGALRRKVWRQGARGQALRWLLDRTLRRHAYRSHRRNRPAEVDRRKRCLLRRSPHRGHQRPRFARYVPPRLRGGQAGRAVRAVRRQPDRRPPRQVCRAGRRTEAPAPRTRRSPHEVRCRRTR